MALTRGALFTLKERKLLTELVTEHKDIIEDRSVISEVVQEKLKVWKSIEESYNANPTITTKRTLKQLRRCWENLKARSKRKQKELEKYDTMYNSPEPKVQITYPQGDPPDPLAVYDPWSDAGFQEKMRNAQLEEVQLRVAALRRNMEMAEEAHRIKLDQEREKHEQEMLFAEELHHQRMSSKHKDPSVSSNA